MTDLMLPPSTEPAPRTVVRLATSYWGDRRGVHQRRSITYLRRLSRGEVHLVEEYADNAGAEDALRAFTNLHKCADGVYEVHMTNVLRDYETGYIDDYDLELVPFVMWTS